MDSCMFPIPRTTRMMTFHLARRSHREQIRKAFRRCLHVIDTVIYYNYNLNANWSSQDVGPALEEHDVCLPRFHSLHYLRRSQYRPKNFISRLRNVQQTKVLRVTVAHVEYDMRESRHRECIYVMPDSVAVCNLRYMKYSPVSLSSLPTLPGVPTAEPILVFLR